MIYRHTRGKVIGDGVVICPQSRLLHSVVAHDADVWQSDIRYSQITNDSKVRASLIENSHIGCNRLESEIIQSNLVRTNVSGGTIAGAYIQDSSIKGRVNIKGDTARGGVKILSSVVKNYATVEGDAILNGVTLSKRMRISTGVWFRAPRYADVIEPELTDIGITESTNGFAFIGCTRKFIPRWLKGKYRFGRAVGWPKDMCDRVALTLEEWIDTPIPTH